MGKVNVVNLDEILGGEEFSIELRGRQYPIRAMGSLSPAEFMRIAKLGGRLQSITDADVNRDGGAEVQKLIDGVISILAPDLPRHQPTWLEKLGLKPKQVYEVSLQEVVTIMEFWAYYNQTKKKPAMTRQVAKSKRP